jgi:hypothetical protein
LQPVLLVIAGPNGLCARTESGLLRKVYGVLPQWVDDCLMAVERHGDFVDLRASQRILNPKSTNQVDRDGNRLSLRGLRVTL